MNIEHRLQHAGRELRELDVHVPELPSTAPAATRRTTVRRGPALVASIALLVAGSAAGVTLVRDDAPSHTDGGTTAVQLHPLTEIQLIAGLADRAAPDVDPGRAGEPRPTPPGVL